MAKLKSTKLGPYDYDLMEEAKTVPKGSGIPTQQMFKVTFTIEYPPEKKKEFDAAESLIRRQLFSEVKSGPQKETRDFMDSRIQEFSTADNEKKELIYKDIGIFFRNTMKQKIGKVLRKKVDDWFKREPKVGEFELKDTDYKFEFTKVATTKKKENYVATCNFTENAICRTITLPKRQLVTLAFEYITLTTAKDEAKSFRKDLEEKVSGLMKPLKTLVKKYLENVDMTFTDQVEAEDYSVAEKTFLDINSFFRNKVEKKINDEVKKLVNEPDNKRFNLIAKKPVFKFATFKVVLPKMTASAQFALALQGATKAAINNAKQIVRFFEDLSRKPPTANVEADVEDIRKAFTEQKKQQQNNSVLDVKKEVVENVEAEIDAADRAARNVVKKLKDLSKSSGGDSEDSATTRLGGKGDPEGAKYDQALQDLQGTLDSYAKTKR